MAAAGQPVLQALENGGGTPVVAIAGQGQDKDHDQGQEQEKENEKEKDLANAGEEVWDEERIEQALEVLKEMHIQLRGLRTTIPRLITPLSTKHISPQALFMDFSQAGKTANQEVQQFRRLMHDEESIRVMEQAKKSRAEQPKGIKPWKVTDHPDWLIREV